MKRRSLTTALQMIHDQIQFRLNHRKPSRRTIFVDLDLSSAFDTTGDGWWSLEDCCRRSSSTSTLPTPPLNISLIYYADDCMVLTSKNLYLHELRNCLKIHQLELSPFSTLFTTLPCLKRSDVN